MARRRKNNSPALPPQSTDDRLKQIEREYANEDTTLLRACERAVVKERYFPPLMDAFARCGKRSLPLPLWLHTVIWTNLEYLLAKDWKRHEAETKRREKHWQRYLDVEELLERRQEARDLNQQVDLARTRDEVFDKVGEKHRVSWYTVRESYLKIQRALRTPDGAPYVARYRVRAASIKKRRKKR